MGIDRMIVKTFIGQNAKEIEERIFKTYGPEAIILTTIETGSDQVEVSFGVEAEEFVEYRKKSKLESHDDFMTLLHNEEDLDNDGFWDEDTIPDVEYKKSITKQVSTESINNLISCASEGQCLDSEKLITFSSINGIDIENHIKHLVSFLQDQGKSVRIALLTSEHTKSQEYDIISTWDELNDYINNYAPKCDHLLVRCQNTQEFLEQWTSAHVIHLISALWKPMDVQSYFHSFPHHENSSIILTEIEITSTPSSLLDDAKATIPPISFLQIQQKGLVAATQEIVAEVILRNVHRYAEEPLHTQ
jgi:flagellar biosynthesis GTPase FlhF